MAVMDKLAKLDSSLQRGLDNSMAALFGGKVVPEEIEVLVKQEAQDSLVVTDRDEYVAPNVYAVGVSSKDLENILGRSNDSDFRLPDTGVSRQHAEITWDGQVAVLVDLQSTNGTTVNDEPVDNWMLADGDVITLGHSNIEVRIVGGQDEVPMNANEPDFTDSVSHPSTEYFQP